MSPLTPTSPTIPAAPVSRATRSTASAVRATKATCAARAANARTSARPNPDVPPVTATRSPLRSLLSMMFSFAGEHGRGAGEARARCPSAWRKIEAMDEPEQIAGHLARNLAALRHVRGLTQDTLAKAAGVPRSTIANLESGEGNPSLAVLVKVAGALGVPIDELLASPRARVRKWSSADIAAQHPGGGVTLRPLVPEPSPNELLL